jgi:hypothetical protein
MVTRDALGDKLEWMEGGHNAELARVFFHLRGGRRFGVGTRRCRHERQQAGNQPQPHAAKQHGNHFHGLAQPQVDRDVNLGLAGDI